MLPVGIYGLGPLDLVCLSSTLICLPLFLFSSFDLVFARVCWLRVDMKLRLVLESSIVGLTSKPAQSTQISDITCPFELSEQSV
jgi:hypothetical protein